MVNHLVLSINRVSLTLVKVGSSVHKHDIRLSSFINANNNHPVHDSSHTRRPNASLFTKCSEASGDNMTNDLLWDIVCRWQGLRLLQDLYLNPHIQSSYLQSQFPYEQRYYSTGFVDTLASESQISASESPIIPASATSPRLQTNYRFSARQTQRFYQALTAYWLLIESYALAEACNYDSQTSKNDCYSKLGMQVRNNEQTLLESCDVLEVYDFTHGYLIRKIFDVEKIPQWIGDTVVFSHHERLRDRWDSFVKTARLRLRPSDVIELFAMGPFRSRCNENEDNFNDYPPDKVEYLRYRGFYNSSGRVKDNDAVDTSDPWFSVRDLENGVESKLRAIETGLVERWARFRSERGTPGARQGVWLVESDKYMLPWIRKVLALEGYRVR